VENLVVPIENVILEPNFEKITIDSEMQSVSGEEGSSTQSTEISQFSGFQPLLSQSITEKPNVFLASIGNFANILGSKIAWLIAAIITILGLFFLFIKR
jgi:hypothetical protein